MPYFETGDRTRLFYVDGGTGAPIVFVSSAWLSSRMWEFQMMPLVERGFRCIAYDRRGHGRSDWTWDGYDYDTLADDLAALLAHLDVHGATLVAHSAGGGEAIRYLTRHGSSGRVARVALVAATAPFLKCTSDNPDAIDAALMEADLAIRTADRAAWFAANANSFLGVGLPGVSVSPEMTQFMIDQCLDCSARATREFFLTGFGTDLRPELTALSIPALVVHGDRDRQAPIELCGRRTAALLPNGRLIVYENAAHGLFLTHAGRLNADLERFVRGQELCK